MGRGLTILAIFAACGACQSHVSQQSNEGAAENAVAPPNDAPPSPDAIAPGQPGGLPDDRNLAQEGPIDPKSAEGAGQVLQHFAALLEQKRFAEASSLGEEDFAAAFDKGAEIHAEIGGPGPVEGAAGSVYVEFPVRFYGRLSSGRPFSQQATATLRRVNDVPGSTEQQRKWRIYRLDMQQPD